MLMPIVMGIASIGMAINMRSGSTSRYIYDEDDIKENQFFIHRPYIKSQYRSLESSSDISDFLSVSGELSARIKADDSGNSIQLLGLGKVLTKTVNRENSIEIMLQVYHETGTLTFPSYIPVKTDWQNLPQERVGSHYIRSVTYGGRLIISLTYTAFKKEYMEEINAAVKANLQFSGSLDVAASGKLEKLTNELSDKARLTIDASATTFFGNVPTSLESVFQIVKDYPETVKKYGNGLGAPMLLEVVPLNTLQKNYTEYKSDPYLNGILEDAADKYDDLRYALNEFNVWVNNPDRNDEQEELVDDYDEKLKKANLAMKRTINAYDPSKGAEQFRAAFKIYGEGDENFPNKYTRMFMYLKHKIDNEEFYWFPYTKAVSHYIRWGNTTCSLPTTDPLYIGYAASSNGFGNGGDLKCLPSVNPSLETRDMNDKILLSQISGVSYKFQKTTGQIFCAYCVLQNATTTFVVTGLTKCPGDSKLEYNGYLMLNRETGTASSPICLDENPVNELPLEEKTNLEKNMSTMVPAWMECPDCEDVKEKYLPCIVCSR